MLKKHHLTSIGDRRLSDHFLDWHLKGTPVRTYQTTLQGQQPYRFFYHDLIRSDQTDWLMALEAWGREHDSLVLSLTPRLEQYWQKLRTWPMTERERFELVFALKQSSPTELDQWDTLMHETEAQLRAVTAT